MYVNPKCDQYYHPRKVPYVNREQIKDYVEHALPLLRTFYNNVWKGNGHELDFEARMPTRRKAKTKPAFNKDPNSSRDLFECMVVAIENARTELKVQGCTQLP